MKTNLDEKTIKDITKLVTDLVKDERHRQFLHEQTWRVKNTRLLLKNYDILKQHTLDIDTDIDVYLKNVFSPEDLKLRSITGYKARTKKMVEYTDLMLEAYKRYAATGDEALQRRCLTLTRTFISKPKLSLCQIAELTNVAEKTVQRDLKKAIEEFSIFMFGIASLEEMVV